MAANMWENSVKNVKSENNKILYETFSIFLQRNGTYCLNKPRSIVLNTKIDSGTISRNDDDDHDDIYNDDV